MFSDLVVFSVHCCRYECVYICCQLFDLTHKYLNIVILHSATIISSYIYLTSFVFTLSIFSRVSFIIETNNIAPNNTQRCKMMDAITSPWYIQQQIRSILSLYAVDVSNKHQCNIFLIPKVSNLLHFANNAVCCKLDILLVCDVYFCDYLYVLQETKNLAVCFKFKGASILLLVRGVLCLRNV